MGATGLQGGAVTRQLLAGGWRVRAVTRDPQSEKAQRLAGLGAGVVRADMADLASLLPVLEGAYGVYSVQNPVLSGVEGEIQQGKNVADAARQAGVQHLVYASTGTGFKGTGIPSWESKLAVEEYMKALGLPLTVLRPVAFMEIMTEKKFFPPVAAWHVMPRLAGGATKIGWVSVEDLGVVAARVFADPQQFAGRELRLVSDVQSIDECRALYREVLGRKPPRWPMPAWMFERYGFVGRDLGRMWRWLRSNIIDLDTGPMRAIHPAALSVRAWLERQQENG
jgi:uncharacterized protein YbjT (DUF2867 family)